MNALQTTLLAKIQSTRVIDLGELRARMPATQRGTAFDSAVLALADTRQIVLAQDCLPESLTPAQLRGYIRCGGEIYTCAMLAR